MQNKERDRGRDPAITVSDDRLVFILWHTCLPQPPRQLLLRAEGAVLGVEQAIGVEVNCPWSRASRTRASPPSLVARSASASIRQPALGSGVKTAGSGSGTSAVLGRSSETHFFQPPSRTETPS